jgi:uncharacterized protein
MTNSPVHSSDNLAIPVSQKDRIVVLDSLRGFALLGILLMNIPYFGLPDPSFDILTLNNEMGTVNENVWFYVNLIFDGTQRGLFSLLFGGGILLFISRLEVKIEGALPLELFVRRQLWLIFFGLINAYVLLWPGDILFQYGIFGILLFLFRKQSVTFLCIAAFISLVLMTARENIDLYRKKNIIVDGEAIARIDTTKVSLTDIQKDKISEMMALKGESDTAILRKKMKLNTDKCLSDYGTIYNFISPINAYIQFEFTYYRLWDVLLFIFLGMAFLKNGLLTGKGSVRVYFWMALVGWSIGLYLTYLHLRPRIEYQFNQYEIIKSLHFYFYEISRSLRTIGMFGLLMLLYKARIFNWFFTLLRPVGQMAFTNYLSQSFICNFIFLGIGLGMMGKVQRYELYYIVAGIWILQIIWSHLWLKRFRFGPMEWAWRSLTYWKRQPLRK